MVEAGMWRVERREKAPFHQWRERRHCSGELVQWDTSVHNWVEDRGPRFYLIAMIDDATSRLFGRFVEHDSAEENMRTAKKYLELYGRPVAFYTDKAGMFETSAKLGEDRDAEPPTQITRALSELGIGRISAHSPQAKGRIERCFGTLQDRLVKQLRLSGARSLEQANVVLEEFLKDWNERFTTPAVNPADAHRPLSELHNLEASLSYVKTPRIENNFTVQFLSKRYQIAKRHAQAGMRGDKARVELRLDGSVALRYHGEYLEIKRCENPEPPGVRSKPAQPPRKDHNRGGRSNWTQNFSVQTEQQRSAT